MGRGLEPGMGVLRLLERLLSRPAEQAWGGESVATKSQPGAAPHLQLHPLPQPVPSPCLATASGEELRVLPGQERKSSLGPVIPTDEAHLPPEHQPEPALAPPPAGRHQHRDLRVYDFQCPAPMREEHLEMPPQERDPSAPQLVPKCGCRHACVFTWAGTSLLACLCTLCCVHACVPARVHMHALVIAL